MLNCAVISSNGATREDCFEEDAINWMRGLKANMLKTGLILSLRYL